MSGLWKNVALVLLVAINIALVVGAFKLVSSKAELEAALAWAGPTFGTLAVLGVAIIALLQRHHP
ncbi:hypothetical protein [Nonomuraea sp. NPDC049784]|uniref:hypothetical protein n=1 Tax=Nonomuraea sp. NPDC049784 TaxID=3154361 RepID=UPI0033FEDFEC